MTPGPAAPSLEVRARILLPVLLFGTSLALRLPELLLIPRFEDEGIEVLWALEIARGQHWPLTGSDAYYGPLFSYLVAGLFAVLGPDLLWPRLLTVTLSALTVPLVYALGRTLADSRVGILAAVLCLANPNLIHQSRYGWSNSLCPFFATVTVLLVHLGTRTERTGVLALAGAFAGLTMQTHPLTAALLPGLIGWHASSRGPARLFRAPQTWASIGGFLLAYAPMIWSFLTAGDALRDRLDVQKYAYAPVRSITAYLERMPDLAAGVQRLAGWIVWLALAAGVLAAIAWMRGPRRARPLAAPSILSWVMVSSLATLPLVTVFFPDRYLVSLLPSAFVWIANLFFRAWDRTVPHIAAPRWWSSRLTVATVFLLAARLLVLDVGSWRDRAARLTEEQATNRAFFELREAVTSDSGCADTVFIENTDFLALPDPAWTHFNFHSARYVLTMSGCPVSVAPLTELIDRVGQHTAAAWLLVPEQSVSAFADRYSVRRVMTLAPAPAVPHDLRLTLLRVQPVAAVQP